MPRSTEQETNELKIFDNISNSSIVLYYRNPTTQERSGYANESVTRKRNKVVTRIPETRLKYGGMILEGFRDGDFTRKKDGRTVPMASDPASPNYDPDWKTQIMTGASDIVMLLAAQVFDISAEAEEPDTPLDGDDAEKN